MNNYRFVAVNTLCSLVVLGASPLMAETVNERLTEAANVLTEVMSAPDKGIPEDLLNDAYCAVIVPGVKKGAFIIGAKYGKGFIVCRNAFHGKWGAPAAVRMEGGSVGWQIGASESDVIMLVMNQRGADRLLQSKFTLGGSASVAAGPVGRTSSANTDAKMTAKMLSWSRSRGVFAGVSLGGATLRQDLDDNAELYGKRLTNKQIVHGKTAVPAAASALISVLSKFSPREDSAGK